MARTPFIGSRTVRGRLSDRAHRPPVGSGARHRRTRPLDRSGLRGRAAGREATGVRLLQRRHGHRTSFQPDVRLLAFARVSKPEGGGGGQECDRNRGGGRRARVALRIRSPRPAPRGGEAIAVVGPLQLPAAKSYAAVLSYAVMRPGDSSRVHTHPGPEGWYVLAGEQCLETPAGANRAGAGGTMTVRPNIPMELNVTGTTLRRAFALVIHDSTQQRGIPSDWKPSGALWSVTDYFTA